LETTDLPTRKLNVAKAYSKSRVEQIPVIADDGRDGVKHGRRLRNELAVREDRRLAGERLARLVHADLLGGTVRKVDAA
jgi:hypothetical protein